MAHCRHYFPPVFAATGIGWLYARWKRPDLASLNQVNMEVLAPLLVFWALAAKPFTAAEFLDLTLGGVAVVLGSGLLLLPLVPLLRVQAKTFLPPMMFHQHGQHGHPAGAVRLRGAGAAGGDSAVHR